MGEVGGSVNRDIPNNVFYRRASAKPNGTSVEHYQRCWTRYNTNVFVLVDSGLRVVAKSISQLLQLTGANNINKKPALLMFWGRTEFF